MTVLHLCRAHAVHLAAPGGVDARRIEPPLEDESRGASHFVWCGLCGAPAYYRIVLTRMSVEGGNDPHPP